MAKTTIQSDNELSENLQKLTRELRKQNSFKRSFTLSIVHGVGYALGASIIAGIVITLLAAIIDLSGGLPFVKEISEIFKG